MERGLLDRETQNIEDFCTSISVRELKYVNL